jgi:hypothetical protein
MAQIDLDLDDLTNAALKRMVKQLLTASDSEQKKILKRLGDHNPSEEAAEGKVAKKAPKNDLADLHEEMHGKPNTPMVTEDDLPYEEDDGEEEMPAQKRKAR